MAKAALCFSHSNQRGHEDHHVFDCPKCVVLRRVARCVALGSFAFFLFWFWGNVA